MWYAGTAPQGRLTVGFRIILAIPQLIVLYFLFIALLFVVVIGWFAALFIGRLPDWAHSFISGVVRWSTRVGAYLLLLTDRYPPFSLDDVDYPARPMLPEPGPLNRVAVLFRIILFVPAAVFLQIVPVRVDRPAALRACGRRPDHGQHAPDALPRLRRRCCATRRGSTRGSAC